MTFLVALGIDYLPTLLLLLVLQLLPLIFWFASTKYERLKTKSDVQASIMYRYFYYQVRPLLIDRLPRGECEGPGGNVKALLACIPSTNTRTRP